ncbi:MAG: HAD-IC family P-type ATPase [Lachnospiraceae bacterium]|nr:HAD-IC family P-type ATPase [Lachnospiraceae bacterium]
MEETRIEENVNMETEEISKEQAFLRSGLTSEEVSVMTSRGEVNTPVVTEHTTLRDIVFENVFTYFNLLFLIIAVCLIMVGSFRDLTFLPVIISNILIGIIQEWRSKRLLNKLTFMAAPQASVIRDGREMKVPSAELVKGDLVSFTAGNQIPADAVVLEGEASLNEALLTGEADEITKRPGDQLLSGSFVVSGTCRARLEKVGAESYISKLTLEAKEGKRGEQSEMIRSLDRLVKIVGVLIIPIAAALFIQQYHFNHLGLRDSVKGTVAAILGMIPEGLFLLASVAMAVSAMRLAMSKVLVHNMKSIETLARADVLCVDKTGTITENVMVVSRVIPLNPEGTMPDASRMITGEKNASEGAGESSVPGQETASGSYRPETAQETVYDYISDEDETGHENEVFETYPQEVLEPLMLRIGDFAACMGNDNITMKAIKTYFGKQGGRRPEAVYPFSPVYKYSGAVFGGKAHVLGAPEFILRDQYPVYASRIERYAMLGYRVLIFALYQGELDGQALREPVVPLGMILLTNPVREGAGQTFRYFEEQGVTIKVISGDNPMTVSEVALEAGIAGAEKFVDATALDESDMKSAVETYTVFGRVTPHQKRQLIAALKSNGHTVAMTGDGVNDVLALKDADCSIAMASGSEAAAQAAQMVLLESDFSRMPAVVNEGRRVVNNIERTASLFLVKNIFSLLLSVFSIIFMLNYPLEPSQVSLIGMFTIGIPAFVMSLETNTGRIRGHFLSNVFFKALPAGLTDFAVISALVIFCKEFNVSETDMSTSCTILLAIVGIMILYRIASPMTTAHWVLWISMIFGILFCMTFMNRIFAISTLSDKSAMLLIIFAIITEPALRYLSILTRKIWQLAAWIRKKIRIRKEEQENLFGTIGRS